VGGAPARTAEVRAREERRRENFTTPIKPLFGTLSRVNDQTLNLPKFVYGTTRLGDSKIPFEDRVALAVGAIEATGFIHTSDQYGDALAVLSEAFAQTLPNQPKQIFKTGWESVDQIRGQIFDQINAVGIDKMTIAQLCLGGQIAEKLRTGDPAARELVELKEEGLVEHFVMEVFPWTSEVPFQALSNGYTDDLIDAFIFYLNPLQRFATNELWDLIVEKHFPVVAMRTVCGGEIHELAGRDSYVGSRAQEVLPLFEKSGCETWTEFCVRFVYGFPFVLTTVGATGKRDNLNAFIQATSGPIPALPPEIQEQILSLQRKWSDQVDRHAQPWTM
jgi:hypothetical protein